MLRLVGIGITLTQYTHMSRLNQLRAQRRTYQYRINTPNVVHRGLVWNVRECQMCWLDAFFFICTDGVGLCERP